MAFDIEGILANMEKGGARPTLFQVLITNPINNTADIKTPFMVEAAQLPGSTIGTIVHHYFGRQIKFPGDREFEPWNVTVVNDEDFAIRQALEEWHQAINKMKGNIAERGSDPALYKSQAIVTQFGKDGTELRTYQFTGVWPSNIAPIELAWSQQNEIERYQVTFEYDTFEVIGGTTGVVGND